MAHIKNKDVINDWVKGRSRRYKSNAFSLPLQTDGIDLWSYDMLIGTTSMGKKVVIVRKEKGLSRNMYRHIKLAKED